MIKISALLRKRIVALFFVSMLILFSQAILLYPSIILGEIKEYQQLKVDQSELAKLCQLSMYRTSTIDTDLTAFNITIKPLVVSKEGKTIVRIKRELHIPYKGVVCITRKTGKGKTTLLEIIAGITHNPETVFVDGQDLNKIPEDAMSTIFCYSPQTPQFLTGALETSVLLGYSYDHKKIITLMKELSLDAFVPLVELAT